MKRLCIAATFAWVCIAATAIAQDPIRGHVFLPPTAGATVLSTQIDAQSRRLVAMGDFLESAAIARRINLESDRIAMENSVLWVETYFNRRRLNREYRDEERIDYEESELKIAEARHRRIAGGAHLGDPAEELNFMMNRLTSDSEAYKSIFLDQVPMIDGVNFELTPDEISDIILKRVGGSQGAQTFRLAKPELVDAGWPKVFLRPEFERLRQQYDQVRQQALGEIAAGELSIKTLELLQRTLKRLEKQFRAQYRWDTMQHDVDIATFTLMKRMGENFLRSQAAGSLRAFAMNSPEAFANDMAFNGASVIDVIRHCTQYNLEFANPDPDGESTYVRLYQQIRELYLEFDWVQPGGF